MANPYSLFESRSNPYSLFPASRSTGLTPRQIAAIQLASQDRGGSLLGSIFGHTKRGLGFVLRQISRANWGMAEGTRRALEGEGVDVGDFFKGFSRGVQAKKHTTFSDVLKQENILDGHGRWRAVAGFGLDVVTDPTLAAMVVATAATGGAASPLLAARVGLMAAAKKGATKSQIAKSLDEAEQALLQAGGELNTQASFRLVREMRRKLNAGDEWNDMDNAMLNMAELGAKQEFDDQVTRVLQLRAAIPFTRGKGIGLTPTSIGGVRVAPKAPSLIRTAERAGVLGKLPGMAAGANVIGRAFRHGFKEEEFAKPQLMAEHLYEQLTERYVREAQARMSPYQNMEQDDMLKALEFGQNADVALVHGPARLIDKDKLARAIDANELTEDQAGFLTAWHNIMERQRTLDKAAGIVYEKEIGDVVYVPNIYTRDGGVANHSALARAGYAMERRDERPITELKRLKENGELANELDIETDLWRMAAIRLRRGARKQSEAVLNRYMRRAYGTPAKIRDMERIARADEVIAGLSEKMNGLKTLNPQSMGAIRGNKYRKIERKGMKRIAAARARFDDKMKELDLREMEHISRLAAKAVGATGPRTPAFSSVAKLSHDSFERNISHFGKTDKVAARRLRGTLRDLSNMKAKIKKVEGAKGHGSKYKALAPEMAAIARTFGFRSSSMDAYLNMMKTRGMSWKKVLQREIAEVEHEAKAQWAELIKKYPPAREPASEAGLRNVDKARARAQRDLNDAILGVQRRAMAEKETVDRLLEERQIRELAQAERLAARIEKREVAKERYYKPNPAARNLTLIRKEIDGEEIAAPPSVAKAMNRVEQIRKDDERMAGLTDTARKLTSYWKVGVTTINPGYRVRNTLSDIWNMYIAGVPTPRIFQYGIKAGKMQGEMGLLSRRMVEAAGRGEHYVLTKKERNLLETFTEAYNHGVLSGLFQGDVQAMADLLKAKRISFLLRDGSINPNAQRAITAPVRAMQTFNRHGENWGRMTHYLFRRESEKLSAQQSATWVKKAHFDYEELTPFEREKLKAFIPFYTWTRKNIPYQLERLLARPGKVATFPKVLASSNELATGDTENMGEGDALMPEWMQERMAFRIPGAPNAWALPGIGLADLSKLENPEEFGQMLHPALRMAYELTTGKSMLTGEDIDKGRRVPISGTAASILEHVPGADVGITSRVVRGERIYGEGASPWVGWLAGQLPMANQLINRESAIKQQQQGNALLPRLAYYGGISVYERDLESEQVGAQIEFNEKLNKVMKRLRDSGALPEAEKRPNSKFNQRINQMLMGGS